MSHNVKRDFLTFMRKMSKKGFYDVLNHVNEKKNVHYNDVLNYLLDKKIVDSRASVTIILNGLTNLGLLERTVTNTRPVRTIYQVSSNGHAILKILRDLETSHSNLHHVG